MLYGASPTYIILTMNLFIIKYQYNTITSLFVVFYFKIPYYVGNII